MTLSQFLALLAGGSGAAAALSWITERIPAFQTLSANVKWWVNLLGTIVLAVAAYAISVFVPADTLTAVAPWFAVIVSAVVAFQINQAAHKADPIA